MNPFSDMTILEQVIEHADGIYVDYFDEHQVTTTGSLPFDENKFDDFLRSNGIGVFQPGQDTEVLIIGREEWNEKVIRDLLTARSGKRLRVYSQEMALLYILFGIDAYEHREILGSMGQLHPALQHLNDIGFYWPAESVKEIASRAASVDVSPDRGVLKHMGYRVGAKSGPRAGRQQILSRAYFEKLPFVDSAEYMRTWGRPQTEERLQKLANSLAAFARNAKKKNNRRMHFAIGDWERDLEWLKENYYKGNYSFPWPSTYIE